MIVQNIRSLSKKFENKFFQADKDFLSHTRIIIFLIFSIWLLRLISLGLYPLMDTTEARYGEIARIMDELNDWISPWFDYEVPFWGKPPLSFWLTALSFRLFGITELAARLPHYLCGAFVAWMVWDLAFRNSYHSALYALAFLTASALFFISSGAVMTDMVLVAGMILSMRSFWLALYSKDQNQVYEKYLFFLGLAISLLAKGPIGFILTYIPIITWSILTRNIGATLRIILWKQGIILTLILVVPWYIIAEIRTPGFLYYFLIGEHWDRFIVPGWKGDLYGSGHHYPRGTIWLFLLVDILPWSILIPIFMISNSKNRENKIIKKEKFAWRLYFILWFLAPVCFFTFAKNILWPYVLPGLPALALLAGDWLEDFIDQKAVKKLLIHGLLVTFILPIVVFISPPFNKRIQNKSAKEIISQYEKKKNPNDNLVFVGKRSFSADFYSKGKAEFISDIEKLRERISVAPAFVAIKNKSKSLAFHDLEKELILISKYGQYELYKTNKNY